MLAQRKTVTDCAIPELRNKRKPRGMFLLVIVISRHLFTAMTTVMKIDESRKIFQGGRRTSTKIGYVFHVSGTV